MTDAIAGNLLAFKNEDQCAQRDVLIGVTDLRPGGIVEIAVDLNMRGVDRIYLRLPLPELVRIALAMDESES